MAWESTQVTCKKNYPKAYIRILETLTTIKTTETLYSTISPKGGFESNKAADFDYFIEKATGKNNDMGQFTTEVVMGNKELNKKWGRTAKERLINILATLTR